MERIFGRSKEVEQECPRCGKRFWQIYSEDGGGGSFVHLDEPCQCEEDYNPVKGSPTLLEWLEQLGYTYDEKGNIKQYKLVDENGDIHLSAVPGQFGGYKRRKIYGRLDCKSANHHIAEGNYIKHRVFFKDEETAIKAGYRPCAKCMPVEYTMWKAKNILKE